MASKPPNTILKYFKALLDLHQPILTRSILEILHAVGDNPTLQLKSDVLLDLMCSLGLSVSTERKAGDEMASIAWLLNVGTRKIYSQNKSICVVKLPLVFTSLGDILASDFEEARFSAVEAFKVLIDNCIDENLVSQGITQIKARHQGLISDPTVIEKICAILEGLLNVRYSDVWDKSFHVTGLARLTYEFSELIGVAYKLLPSTFLLMQRNNQEIVKANLGFIKALVAKSKADVLHEHLKGVVEGLFSWQSDTKNSFKAKVKSLMEILVNKCGLDAVKAVIPEEHMKLLTNIRKINERKMRKAKSSEDGDSMSMTSGATRQSRWNHTQMFSDFGSDEDDSNGPFSALHTVASRTGSKASKRSNRKRQEDKSLLEKFIDQSTGEPLDLLDQKTVRLALKSAVPGKKRATPDDEEEVEMDPEGRIIVREERERRKKKPVSRDDEADEKSSIRSQSVKRRKMSSSGWAYTGHEYTSKKAGGDLKKKDKMDPYAYWPLDRKLLNRRSDRKASARKGMASVMKVTKRLEGKSASSALAAKKTQKRKQKKNK